MKHQSIFPQTRLAAHTQRLALAKLWNRQTHRHTSLCSTFCYNLHHHLPHHICTTSDLNVVDPIYSNPVTNTFSSLSLSVTTFQNGSPGPAGSAEGGILHRSGSYLVLESYEVCGDRFLKASTSDDALRRTNTQTASKHTDHSLISYVSSSIICHAIMIFPGDLVRFRLCESSAAIAIPPQRTARLCYPILMLSHALRVTCTAGTLLRITDRQGGTFLVAHAAKHGERLNMAHSMLTSSSLTIVPLFSNNSSPSTPLLRSSSRPSPSPRPTPLLVLSVSSPS